MAEDNLDKILEAEMKKEFKARPELKTVPTPVDPSRTTKQMLEQFNKIKQGLEADLANEMTELRQVEERVDDLNHAIRVISAGITMLKPE